MKWNISLIRGKKTNKYFVSTGEGMRIKKMMNLWSIKYKKYVKILFSNSTEGFSPVLQYYYILMSRTRVKLFEYSKTIC